jgi:hypothetical protein
MSRKSKQEKTWKPETATVTWLDACTREKLAGPLEEVLKQAVLFVRESVGYLLQYDEKLLILAQDYDAPEKPDDKPEVSSITVIPSAWVLKVKVRGRLVKLDMKLEGKNGPEKAGSEGTVRVPEPPILGDGRRDSVPLSES